MKRINYIREVAQQAEQDNNLSLYERAVRLLNEAWSLFFLNCDNLPAEILRQAANDLEV